jgi:hypothetical protein
VNITYDLTTHQLIRVDITTSLRLDDTWVRGSTAPMHLGLKERALCAPAVSHGSPAALLKFQMAPRLMFLMFSGSKKEPPKYACLNEARASHLQRILHVKKSPFLSGFTDSPCPSATSLSVEELYLQHMNYILR